MGVTMRRKISDRAIAMPIGRETTIAVIVAAIMSAMVLIASSQSSMTPRKINETNTTVGKGQRRVAKKARAVKKAMINHQGIANKPASMLFKSHKSGIAAASN